MSVLRTAYHHAWQNFFMPDRLPAYRLMLRKIKAKGYRFCTVDEFAARVKGGAPSDTPICVLRQDVDSDPAGAGRMFDADCAEGVRATYYFRLTTIDPRLMGRIRLYGSEAGYHFEELATYAKRYGLRRKEDIPAHTAAIRDQFRRNVEYFHAAAGFLPRTVAAHGDFMNRRLGILNNAIVDRALMDEFGIVAETYEQWLMAAVTARVADRAAPVWWHPYSPELALRDTPRVLYILVHPRQWVRAPLRNTGLDILRVAEEVTWRWRAMRRGA